MKTERTISRFLLLLAVGLLFAVQSFAQGLTVKGVVKDATGESVIGANVIVKGTTNGTITDFDGNFQLQANQGDIIVISFIGYLPQELPAAAEMNVILKEDSETLEEVVVIGYGAAKKNDLTGSVTAIKPDKMNRGLVTNAQDMMAGKIAGVSVISDGGTPGGGAQIRVRGGSSLSASNNPLIVIDGLAMDNDGVQGLSNPLSMVNPADIESFTVLKDASATAIYGSRASNGVIIITTKKGQAHSKPNVFYNGNVSAGFLRNKLDVMSADEFRSYIKDYYGEDSDAYRTMGKANTDWQDQIYRTAISTDHNVTVSGGYKNVPYRVTVGYTNQNGIVKTSKFERYTASLNLSPTFFEDHLKVNANLKAMLAKNRFADGAAIGDAVRFDPTQDVHSTDPGMVKSYGGYFQWNGTPVSDEAWPLFPQSLAPGNPVATLELVNDRSTAKSLVGNLEVDYKFHCLPDLRFHMNGGMDLSTGKQTTDKLPTSFQNNYYGSYGYTEKDKYNLSFNAYLQYMKEFKAFRFDVMGGYEWQHFHNNGEKKYAGFYPSTAGTNAGKEYQPSFSEWEKESFLVSFFGRGNITFFERYMLTATVRHDGSSRFSKDNRWGTFPAFAFAWKINDEPFMQKLDWLSDFKLRLGYGITG